MTVMPEPGQLGPERDIAVTFKTTRGEFTVPAELFEDGREYELSVYFAQRLPVACSQISRRIGRDGVVTITWRKIRVIPDRT